jgi:peptidoglycan/LPS O-acetylase OafA/YrhL
VDALLQHKKISKQLVLIELNMYEKNRIDYLDSVRGIAAFMVVVYHYIGWRWEKTIGFKLGALFFNGSDAVSLFFVLSGFVLSFKYFQTGQAMNLKEYIIKRFYRIYPAYFVTILMMYLYNNYGLGIRLFTDLFYFNTQKVWQELYLVKSNHTLYIPGWTLGVEMVLSLLLPFFIAAAQKNIHYIFALIPISLYIGAGHLSQFTMHFCLGILLAYFYPQIQTFDFKNSKMYPYRWLIFLLVFALFSIRHLDRMHPLGDKIYNLMGFWGIDLFHITGIASFFILLFIINNPVAQKILTIKPFLFLGKISYSIYLMHWIVIIFVMEHWAKWQHIFVNDILIYWIMLLFTIISTLLLATACYYFVEQPFLKKKV